MKGAPRKPQGFATPELLESVMNACSASGTMWKITSAPIRRYKFAAAAPTVWLTIVSEPPLITQTLAALTWLSGAMRPASAEPCA